MLNSQTFLLPLPVIAFVTWISFVGLVTWATQLFIIPFRTLNWMGDDGEVIVVYEGPLDHCDEVRDEPACS